MPRKKKIIFISHDASLSGAPVLLTNLIQLISKYNIYESIIVIKRGGRLEKRFQMEGKTFIYKPVEYQKGNFVNKVIDYFFSRLRLFQILWQTLNADIIFSNTITNGRLLKFLSISRKPVISYIHELTSVVEFYERFKDSSLTISNSIFFLYPSIAVSDLLQSRYKINSNKKILLPYYFPTPAIFNKHEKLTAREVFAQKYNLDSKVLWIVNMGTICTRKGITLFLETAALTKKMNLRARFIWIGDYEHEEIKWDTIAMVKKMGLEDIIFTGPLPYHTDNLLPFDIFLLSSIEDPYPLVVVEAAYLAIPTICFESGGITEFVENDAGWIISDFSAANAVECINELEIHSELIIEKGKKAMTKAKERHSDAEMIITTFNKAVDAVI